MTLPTLDTERLILRPRVRDDLEACLAMDRAPGVVRWVPGPWHDPIAHRAFVEARLAAVFPDGLGYWTVVERAARDRFLGWVLLIPVDGIGPEIEIGWRLRPEVWGRGVATEAAARLIAHAEALEIDQVIADIHADNAASRRVAAKIGMVEESPVERDGHAGFRYVARLSPRPTAHRPARRALPEGRRDGEKGVPEAPIRTPSGGAAAARLMRPSSSVWFQSAPPARGRRECCR